MTTWESSQLYICDHARTERMLKAHKQIDGLHIPKQTHAHLM